MVSKFKIQHSRFTETNFEAEDSKPAGAPSILNLES
jgi:hypothetical protein